MERTIGFSTGALYKKMHPVDPQIVAALQSYGCDAIEFNIHSFDAHACFLNSFDLQRFLNDHGKRFKHISVHLPNDIKYKPLKTPISTDQRLAERRYNEAMRNDSFRMLSLISRFAEMNKMSYALVHPDMVKCWSLFNEFNFPVALENMDQRKKSFRTVGSMATFFEKNPGFKFVFDVNHWVANGNSVSRIPHMIEIFKNELTGIHLSGFQKYHEPLFKTKQKELVEAIAGLPPDIPIIIKSVCDSLDDIGKELDYVRKILC